MRSTNECNVYFAVFSPPLRRPDATASVVGVDIGKFGTAYAYSWMSAVDSIPSVGTLDMDQSGEELRHKSPNSLLVLPEGGADGNFRSRGEVVVGDMADTRYGSGNYPPGSQLFRRFGRQRRRAEEFGLFVGSGTGTSVKSSSKGSISSESLEIELSGILVDLLTSVKDVSKKSKRRRRVWRRFASRGR